MKVPKPSNDEEYQLVSSNVMAYNLKFLKTAQNLEKALEISLHYLPDEKRQQLMHEARQGKLENIAIFSKQLRKILQQYSRNRQSLTE